MKMTKNGSRFRKFKLYFLPFCGEKACKSITLPSKDFKCTYLVVVRGAAVVEKIRSVKIVRREEVGDEAGGAVALGAGTPFMR